MGHERIHKAYHGPITTTIPFVATTFAHAFDFALSEALRYAMLHYMKWGVQWKTTKTKITKNGKKHTDESGGKTKPSDKGCFDTTSTVKWRIPAAMLAKMSSEEQFSQMKAVIDGVGQFQGNKTTKAPTATFSAAIQNDDSSNSTMTNAPKPGEFIRDMSSTAKAVWSCELVSGGSYIIQVRKTYKACFSKTVYLIHEVSKNPSAFLLL